MWRIIAFNIHSFNLTFTFGYDNYDYKQMTPLRFGLFISSFKLAQTDLSQNGQLSEIDLDHFRSDIPQNIFPAKCAA